MIKWLIFVLNRGLWQMSEMEETDLIDCLFTCANNLISEACDGGTDEDLSLLESLQGAQSPEKILAQINEILSDYDCEICGYYLGKDSK